MSNLKSTIGAAAALGVLATGAMALPAQADTADATVTSTATIKNSPDDGTPPWARDSFTRTTTITKNDDGSYKVHVDDKGTFKTAKSTLSPNDPTVRIKRSVKGDLSGTADFTVTDGKLKGPKQLAKLDGQVLRNGRALVKTDVKPRRSTSTWPKRYFKANPAATVTLDAWHWEYTTPCGESYTQDKNAAAEGNIVGKTCKPEPTDTGSPSPTPTDTKTPPVEGAKVPQSVLTATNVCRMSKSDKRNVWDIKNVAGPRTRTFWLHVSYKGHATYEGQHTVAAGDTNRVTTSHGGKLKLGYYDGRSNHVVKYAWSSAKKLCK